MADCLETNGNSIDKEYDQKSVKFKNNTNINIYNQFKVEGNVEENNTVADKNCMVSG